LGDEGNPSVKAMKKAHVIINAERCKACLLCVEVCSRGCIRIGASLNTAGYVPVEFDDSCDCIGCALCAIRCPEVAIEIFSDE
jgi:2-oxoglutarate ferredoxin oxidoreductase subunit delta